MWMLLHGFTGTRDEGTVFDAEGNELFRHEGFYKKESILAKFAEHGIDLKKVDKTE